MWQCLMVATPRVAMDTCMLCLRLMSHPAPPPPCHFSQVHRLAMNLHVTVNSVSVTLHSTVIQIAHPQVQLKLLDLIYHGFLVSVMASSLSQVGNVQISGPVSFIFGNLKVKKTNLCISYVFHCWKRKCQFFCSSGNLSIKKAMEHRNIQ